MKNQTYAAMRLRLIVLHDHLDDIAAALAVVIQKAPFSYPHLAPLDATLIDVRSIQGRIRAVIDHIKGAELEETK